MFVDTLLLRAHRTVKATRSFTAINGYLFFFIYFRTAEIIDDQRRIQPDSHLYCGRAVSDRRPAQVHVHRRRR